MSYLRKFQYKIIPDESYTILRNCSICGGKSSYVNSNNFRVNANGKRIDVWLIYQCERCKHTYNLSIHRNYKADCFSKDVFYKFIENDSELAIKIGTDKSLFARNKAEIDFNNIRYHVENIVTGKPITEEITRFQIGDTIILENTHGLKVRTDKIIAEILQITRNKLRDFETSEIIKIIKDPLSQKIKIELHGEIYIENQNFSRC